MSITKVSYSMISGKSANVLDFGADSSGVSDSQSAIQAAINSGNTVYFPAGTYKVASVIAIPTGMKLYANGDATILSTIASVPLSYQQIFVATVAVSNISVQGLKFQTSQVAFAAFGFQELVTNLDLLNNECQGCSLITTFAGAANALIEGNYIHSPANEGTSNDYARAIQISTVTTPTTNLHIANNTILGSFTHGIEVFGGDVQAELDPFVAKLANDIVVSGNIVKAVAGNTTSAGAIWFSQCANVTVTNNVCEAYWDVGIDFEACFNAVASDNALKNNNKNLAMYGNSNNVVFSGNVCHNTVAGLQHFYAKPAQIAAGYDVDIRNTNILIDGNSFITSATVTGFERLELGSGGKITVSNNQLVNTSIYAANLSLTEVVIKDNTIDFNASGVAQQPIQRSIGYVTGDASTTPFRTVISGNVITHSNPSATAYVILVQIGDPVNGSQDFDVYLDVLDNICNDDPNKFALYIQTSGTITGTKYLYDSVRNNRFGGSIQYNTAGNRTLVHTVVDNYAKTGHPYTTTYTLAGALNTWDISNINTTGLGAILYLSLADGDYSGQQKVIYMTAVGSFSGSVIIANHRLGLSQQAVFSGVGQYCILQWNVNRWDTVVATCAGI